MFLYLEDLIKQGVELEKILDNNSQEVSDTEGILTLLYSFYQGLYSMPKLSPAIDQIKNFLDCVPSLLKILGDTSMLTLPISDHEVINAIKYLRPGKSPGYDGIIAEFYKHFAESLSNILAAVFNQVLEDGTLSLSQKLAIIILIFKKGDPRLIANYRPISLTNCDYKILAYIFVK